MGQREQDEILRSLGLREIATGGTMSKSKRAIVLACRAANVAQLAACYREEAIGLEREARKLDPDGDWSVDPDGAEPRGLPDDWMDIGDRGVSP